MNEILLVPPPTALYLSTANFKFQGHNHNMTSLSIGPCKHTETNIGGKSWKK